MDVQLDEFVHAISRPGSIGILPTDTLYGVVARAIDEKAVQRLYALKSRDHKPGTLLAANIEQLVLLGMKRRYLTSVERFWPGAISIVIPCGSELAYLHQAVGSIAVRIPADNSLRVMLDKTGPLLTSSANLPGEPPATTIDEAKGYFGNRVDFYVDGGDLSRNEPSTIIRVVDDAIEILRPGAVHINEQGEIL